MVSRRKRDMCLSKKKRPREQREKNMKSRASFSFGTFLSEFFCSLSLSLFLSRCFRRTKFTKGGIGCIGPKSEPSSSRVRNRPVKFRWNRQEMENSCFFCLASSFFCFVLRLLFSLSVLSSNLREYFFFFFTLCFNPRASVLLPYQTYANMQLPNITSILHSTRSCRW